MLKDIKDKLHSFLFPRYQQKIRAIVFEARKYKHNYHITATKLKELQGLFDDRSAEVREIRRDMDKLNVKPTIADLMNEILGSSSMNFSNTESDGYPKHFLDTLIPAQREAYVAQLHQIHNLEVWKDMTDYHTNVQGNFIARHAEDDTQMLCGRMTINGISLLKTDVDKGHLEYQDRSKPPDDFDPYSVELLQDELIDKFK